MAREQTKNRTCSRGHIISWYFLLTLAAVKGSFTSELRMKAINMGEFRQNIVGLKWMSDWTSRFHMLQFKVWSNTDLISRSSLTFLNYCLKEGPWQYGNDIYTADQEFGNSFQSPDIFFHRLFMREYPLKFASPSWSSTLNLMYQSNYMFEFEQIPKSRSWEQSIHVSIAYNIGFSQLTFTVIIMIVSRFF